MRKPANKLSLSQLLPSCAKVKSEYTAGHCNVLTNHKYALRTVFTTLNLTIA